MTGLTLAHYRIDAELGRGGMGIVYKATDTKLNRTVALKVLPAAALASDDDRARFFREAQAAAQLHHPNIATVFQIDEALPLEEGGEPQPGTEKRLFIAMEYIEGETVYDRVKAAPLPLKDAVSIAGQIAEALKEAHAKEIVHRDIKSQNVMLTRDGIAKVLDFGLAKTNQSTMLTRMGSTLGTVAYMSPEQARGQEVDGRSDLYSLGTVLYEMVAGRLPFGGDYEQAIMYAILNEPPEPLTALRTGVPMELERITAKLLSKEAEYRYQSAAGLLADLKALDVSGSGMSRRSMAAAPAASTNPSRTIPSWVWGAFAVSLLMAGALGAWLSGGGSDPSPREPAQFAIDLPDVVFPVQAAWMPDGSALFYRARPQPEEGTLVYRYDLASGAATPVAGTEDLLVASVSPDGRWLLLYDPDADLYRKALTQGGSPSAITGSDTGSFTGGAIRNDGTLYFTTSSGQIARVTSTGEREIIGDNAGTGHFFVLPYVGGPSENAYWIAGTTPNAPHDGGYLKRSDDSLRLAFPRFGVLGTFGDGYALLMPTGQSDGEPLLVAPFDVEQARLLAEPVPWEPAERPALSRRGHLLYQASQGVSRSDAETTRVIDAEGGIVDHGSVPNQSGDMATAWSMRAAIVMAEESDDRRDLYHIDLDSGTQTRLTRDGNNASPSWSADDEFVYFRRVAERGQTPVIARRRVDGAGDIELVHADSSGPANPAVSPDGRHLVYASRVSPSVGWDVWIKDLESGDTRILAGGEGAQSDASFSPDGRYVVYRSSNSGDLSIVVTPVDGQGDIELTSDGNNPVWSRDGRFIYVEREGASQIVRIPVTTEPIFRITGSEEVVYEISRPFHLHFDLLSDGSIVTSEQLDGSALTDQDPEIRVVLNFDVLAERLAPRNP